MIWEKVKILIKFLIKIKYIKLSAVDIQQGALCTASFSAQLSFMLI